MALIHVTRRFEFRSVHALETGPRRERRHGHRYLVEVTLRERDDLALDRVMNEVMTDLHGREIDHVTGGPSTGERLVEWIDQRLRASALANSLCAVALRETAKNRFVSARSEERYV